MTHPILFFHMFHENIHEFILKRGSSVKCLVSICASLASVFVCILCIRVSQLIMGGERCGSQEIPLPLPLLGFFFFFLSILLNSFNIYIYILIVISIYGFYVDINLLLYHELIRCYI